MVHIKSPDYGYSTIGKKFHSSRPGHKKQRISMIACLADKSLFAPFMFEGDCDAKLKAFVCTLMVYTIAQSYKDYQRRWSIETYHRSLKQITSLGISPTSVEKTQSNHICLSLLAYLKLEKISYVMVKITMHLSINSSFLQTMLAIKNHLNYRIN